jgi:hypothetical protein
MAMENQSKIEEFLAKAKEAEEHAQPEPPGDRPGKAG